MNKFAMALGLTGALLLALPAQASKAVSKEAGNLVVFGNSESKLFTQDGIDRAKSAFGGVQFDHGLHMTIDTYAEVPEGKKAALAATGEDKVRRAKFFRDWAHERATDKGPYVLICHKPGHIEVIVDKQSRERGFTDENRSKLKDILLKGFQDAKDKPEAEQLQIRDNALKAGIDYVISDLKGTATIAANKPASGKAASGSTGMGIGGWICIGVVVLLVIWVAIALFRALSGGGGGGGGMGGGGGGGGGGFMSSMFGGLFGAMAGMWIYNSMFGGGSMFGGSDSSNNSYGDSGGDTGGGDAGAGDYGGDAGSGGDYDAGGGGDFGGGGDWGGGGDGGGGGDF